jgi:MFS family permease
MKSPTRLVAGMCAAETFSMVGNASFAALLPLFAREWQLSNSDAGWVDGLFFAGYVVAVPILTSLTDRVDARRVYLAAAALGAVASLGFALTAHGFWSAAGWRVLAGISLAGTYMPGLKAMNDRIGGKAQSRAIAFYTASFGVGLSASYFIAGEAAAHLGWQAAFFAAAIGSALSFVLAAVALGAYPAERHDKPPTRLLDFRPVFANRAAMGYVLGYAAHAWELFGLRSWLVAFLTFALMASGGDGGWLKPTIVATIVMLVGMPASIFGNELALRIGRRRAIVTVMIVSGSVGCVIGFLGGLGYGLAVVLVLAYAVVVIGDSASLTAGMIESADPAYRGATMAVHSTVGFAGAEVSPPLFGLVLDLTGGRGDATAWGLAFISIGVMGFIGPFALLMGRRALEARPAG